MQMSLQQWRTSRERRSYKRFAAERRVAEVDALRAAARDLRIVGQMDSTQTAEWLDHRAGRIEHPEPMHPVVEAAVMVGFILAIALMVFLLITGDFSHIRPL